MLHKSVLLNESIDLIVNVIDIREIKKPKVRNSKKTCAILSIIVPIISFVLTLCLYSTCF